jgi:hypothetical protein
MATIRTVLERYKSISRPKGLSGQSTYFTTLAKRTMAAEDDVVDHNYSIGILSAEGYMNELMKRNTRVTNTPLQRTNLQQKIVQVQEDYNDSIMQNQYKAGQVTDRQMYDYEKGKLATMSAADSTAYQTQAAKVQGLLDKAEKADRKQYRITETNRISRMPEDTSALMQSKADMYMKLRDMAIADGDQNDATSLDTTYNNYVSAGQRTAINEQVQSSSNAIKEQYHPSEPGVSTNGTVPSVTTENAGVPSGLPGSNATSGADGTGVPGSAPADAVDASVQQAIAEGQKKLDTAMQRYKLMKERESELIDSIAEDKDMRSLYADTVSIYKKAGEVDYAASTQEKVKNYDRSILESQAALKQLQGTLTEAEQYVQEVQKDVTYKTTFVQKQAEENKILDAEQNLNLSLQTGEITKEEYLDSRREIVQQKVNLYTDIANLYGEFDKLNPNADMTRKAQKEELVNLRQATSDMNNAGRYELVDAGDGTVKLTDVYKLKMVGKTFEQDHLQDGNVWRKVLIPDAVDAQGNPLGLSSAIKEGYSMQSGTAFVVKMVDGVMTQVPITVYNNKPIEQSAIEQGVGENKIIFDPKKNTWVDAPGNVFQQAGNVAKNLADSPIGRTVLDTKVSPNQFLAKQLGGVGNIGNLAGNAFNAAKGFFGNLLSPYLRNTKLPNLRVSGQESTEKPAVPTVPGFEYPYGDMSDYRLVDTPEQYKQVIADAARTYGIDENILTNLLAKESSWDPAVISGKKSSKAGALGVAQFMPATAKWLGINPLDTTQAINGAAKYLSSLNKKFGDMSTALAAYNWGEGNVTNYGVKSLPLETSTYVKAIMKNQKDAPVTTPVPTATSGTVPAYTGPITSSTSVAPAQAKTNVVSMQNPNSGSNPNTKVINNVPSVKQYDVNKGFVYQPISSTPKYTPPPPAPAPKPAPAPAYNPIQTFQSNVNKVVDLGKNVLSKLKFW